MSPGSDKALRGCRRNALSLKASVSDPLGLTPYEQPKLSWTKASGDSRRLVRHRLAALFLDAKCRPVAIPPHRPTVAQVPQSPPL